MDDSPICSKNEPLEEKTCIQRHDTFGNGICHQINGYKKSNERNVAAKQEKYNSVTGNGYNKGPFSIY